VLPVVVGILTSLIIFAAKVWIDRSLKPWLFEIFSKGSYHVTGTWLSDFEVEIGDRKIQCIETINLVQVARKVTGETDYKEFWINDQGEKELRKSFRFQSEGHFESRMLNLTFYCQSGDTMERGTAAMFATNDDEMVGYDCFYDPDVGKIVASEVKWHRQNKR
jgi:hypothetical protein